MRLATDTDVADLYDRLVAEQAAFARHMPSLFAALAEFENVDKDSREAWRAEDRTPAIELMDLVEGVWPRRGFEAGLDLVRRVEASGVLGHIEEFMTRPPEVALWPRDVAAHKVVSDRMGFMRPCRYLSKVWAVRMRIAAVEGRREDAARRFEEMLAMANAARSRLLFLDRMIGNAVVAAAIQELRAEVMEGLHDEQSLRACMTALERAEAGPPLDATFEVEMAFGQNYLNEYMTVVQKGHPPLPAERIIEELKAGLVRAVDLQHEPIKLRGANSEVETPAQIAASVWATMANPPSTEETLRTVSGAFVAQAGWAAHLAVDVRGVRVMLAVEIERMAKGRVPATLDELVPARLASLPTDPLTGEPFRYKLPEPDVDGGSYVLYSVGVDGTDDDGRWDPKRPHRAMERDGKGWDLLFNRSRSEPFKPDQPEDSGPPKF